MDHGDEERERARQAELDALKLAEFEEAAFEDIARMARDVCGTPVALVSIVDGDRQWFKARVGIEADETPRAISFCTHTIQRPDEVMVVEDATKDPRFAENPLVVGAPGIRFYAGAPLVMPSGRALGTVCVIDTEPRQVSQAQIDELVFLAKQVVSVLEARKRALGIDETARAPFPSAS